ncbi:hypothetical protein [uncultured Friedmanniella sp.]|uniref:hypothetical protein n=1 Tax=uncultured Friedmanniella sp. TaxID=335381 RepID=UPI0035CC605E
MFVQVVRGVVRDPEETFARLDLWLHDLAPAARGWLGTTAGVTRDGELVSFVRFASAADARHNSDRMEQGQWWVESARVFAGDVSFDNYDGVTVFGDGGSDDAVRVEVLLGRVPRRRDLTGLAAQLAEEGLAPGAQAIGGMVGLHEDGLTQAVYYHQPNHCPDAHLVKPVSSVARSLGLADLRLLHLERLWFGSPSGAVRQPGHHRITVP